MTQQQEMELLSRAFETFKQASNELGISYQLLEKKVESLNRELDIKNRDLEKNLAEKEKVKAYLHNILENLTTGVIVVDLSGRVTVLNRMAEVLIGSSMEEVQEKGIPTSLGVPGTFPGLTEMLEGLNDKPLDMQVKGERRSIHLTTSGLYDGSGPLIGGIFLLKDVTEIKRLEQEAERKNRLTAMGEMSANIAHEIRNPLGGIELFASILRKELQDEPDRKHLAENIIVGVKSLNHIISNLLFYTRPLRPTCTPVSARGIVEEAFVFSEIALRQSGVQCTFHHQGPDIRISSDGELLKQIFMNLILNAVQAMPGGGALRIESSIHEQSVAYRLTDTGKGIEEEDLGKIFNPFFTTRNRGTGLGLAIVHQLVESLDGRILVESRVDHGTTFNLTFPRENVREAEEPLSLSDPVPETVL